METELTQFVFKYWFQWCWWALEPTLLTIPLHGTDTWICWWAELKWFVVLLSYTLRCDLNCFNAFLQALPSLFLQNLEWDDFVLHDHHCTMVTSSSSCSCGSTAYSKFWSRIVIKKNVSVEHEVFFPKWLNLPKPRPQYHGMALHFAHYVGCVT
jgi:hypothetical protein